LPPFGAVTNEYATLLCISSNVARAIAIRLGLGIARRDPVCDRDGGVGSLIATDGWAASGRTSDSSCCQVLAAVVQR